MDKLDFPFDNLGKRNIRRTHGRAGLDERGAATVQLAHPLGDQIYEDEGVGDDFRSLFNKITFHSRAGKERIWLRLLKGDDILQGLGLSFFAQNNSWEGYGLGVKPEITILCKPKLACFRVFSRFSGNPRLFRH